MVYAIYDKNTGIIARSIDIPEFMIGMIELANNEAMVEIPRMGDDSTEYIKDGKLTPKPIP